MTVRVLNDLTRCRVDLEERVLHVAKRDVLRSHHRVQAAVRTEHARADAVRGRAPDSRSNGADGITFRRVMAEFDAAGQIPISLIWWGADRRARRRPPGRPVTRAGLTRSAGRGDDLRGLAPGRTVATSRVTRPARFPSRKGSLRPVRQRFTVAMHLEEQDLQLLRRADVARLHRRADRLLVELAGGERLGRLPLLVDGEAAL